MSSPLEVSEASPGTCPRCQAALTCPLACNGCGILLTLPPGINHFTLLGLDAAFRISTPVLEKAYLKASRLVHPDFFGNRPAEEQRQALRFSALLNEAYRVLKDPVQRAEYLLRLSGGKTADSDKRTPPGFLAQMLAFREEIEEGELTDARRRQIGSQADAHMKKLLDEVSALFESDARSHLDEIRGRLNSYYYLRTLKENLGGVDPTKGR